MAGLRLEHIYKVYPNGTKAVSDFTMEIEDKEFIVFVGPSGCGKSTTLRMIAGLEDISAGELYIGDRIVNDVEPKDRDIAMVFQNYALYPHMTVYENMAFGLKLRHVPNAEIHEKVLWAAKVLDLTEYLDRKPRAMSGGQRQRVALGRAILRNPKVMLLDEPLSNLDAKLRAQMRSEIAKLHSELQTTFIYVTHDQVEAMTLGTRVVVMRLGRVMQIDSPKNLYDYPNNLFVAGFIGTPQMNFFHAYLTRNKDNIHIDFKWSDNALDVPQSLLAKVQPQYFDGEKEVIIGLRCEHLSLDPEIVSKSKYVFDVRVSHFEELGNETLIYGDINMQGDGFTETATRVIVKGTSNYGLEKGKVAKCAINVEKMHMFDSITEGTINPRIPTENLVTCEIKDGHIVLGTTKFALPNAIHLENGTYDLLMPTSAVEVSKAAEGKCSVAISEKIGDVNLLGIEFGKQLLFATHSELIKEGAAIALDLDFTKIKFLQNNEVVLDAVPEYDRVNAIFMNYQTAKSFVGNKYDSVLEDRISAVKNEYEPKMASLTEDYNSKCEEARKVDSKAIEAKNAATINESKLALNEALLKAKEEFQVGSKKLKEAHQANNARIVKEVDDMYAKIKADEFSSFEQFKQINKDKDAYRKRNQELREFKATIGIEKKNELDKRINLEAVSYESDLNALKGNYRRTVEGLKKNHKDLLHRCKDEAYPIKALSKTYKKEMKALKAEYQMKLNLANIIFFFKANQHITLSSDAISNKMIQGLGVKVFTKQYIIEIPHDAYCIGDEGLELKVLNVLDFDSKKYLHCSYTDDYGTSDVYILVNEDVKQETIKVTFDITKAHITEKSMDIKIY
ncbi:MAG: sn-glycerol-3-phosphate ABC transporter ATP-binding protein UgpC [Anaeroplasmataceae bacterium]|nr:sn-glycerol-3-phosphate ABC transporter ATP-binding protein UgpC [Anaeroplasmataceae bacterium]